eukprot:3938684-Rhodomonas_salina.5
MFLDSRPTSALKCRVRPSMVLVSPRCGQVRVEDRVQLVGIPESGVGVYAMSAPRIAQLSIACGEHGAA